MIKHDGRGALSVHMARVGTIRHLIGVALPVVLGTPLMLCACSQAVRSPIDGTQPGGMFFALQLGRAAGSSVAPTLTPPLPTTPKVTFVTTVTNGNLGGIAGADAFCMADANKPALPAGASYKALLVDGVNRRACTTADCGGGFTEHIDWVFRPSSQYLRADGVTPVHTTNADGIFVFPMANTFGTGSSLIFTGLDANWTTNAATCLGWASSNGGDLGGAGIENQPFSVAIDLGAPQACNSVTLVLVCIEQP